MGRVVGFGRELGRSGLCPWQGESKWNEERAKVLGPAALPTRVSSGCVPGPCGPALLDSAWTFLAGLEALP